jgi:hypothetical protein
VCCHWDCKLQCHRRLGSWNTCSKKHITEPCRAPKLTYAYHPIWLQRELGMQTPVPLNRISDPGYLGPLTLSNLQVKLAGHDLFCSCGTKSIVNGFLPLAASANLVGQQVLLGAVPQSAGMVRQPSPAKRKRAATDRQRTVSHGFAAAAPTYS